MDIIRKSIALPNDIESTITSATSPFLSKALDVMQTKPLWQSYLHGHMISEQDYNFITTFESYSENERTELLKQPDSQKQFAKTFLTIIATMSKEHTVQYTITLLDNSLREDKSRVDFLKYYTDGNNQELWEYFINLLTRPDPFVVHQASRIIAKIACWSSVTVTSSDLSYYLTWLKNQLESLSNPYVQTACRCLQMILRIKEYQNPFIQSHGFAQMCLLLSDDKLSFQLQYQIIFCLWLITFTSELADFVSSKSIIPRLVTILFSAKKEKVIRIILMLFRNLLVKPSNSLIVKNNARALLASHFLKNIDRLENKELDDEEFGDDIEFLKEQLEIGLEEITSFDEYYIELQSGCLNWSPVHKSENFWRENIDQFNDEGFKMLRMLLKLIEEDVDPVTTSVAIHDIGNYVQFYFRGKMIINKLDGKRIVTLKLQHENASVRYEALVCVQKLMLQNWDYMDNVSPSTPGASPVKG